MALPLEPKGPLDQRQADVQCPNRVGKRTPPLLAWEESQAARTARETLGLCLVLENVGDRVTDLPGYPGELDLSELV